MQILVSVGIIMFLLTGSVVNKTTEEMLPTALVAMKGFSSLYAFKFDVVSISYINLHTAAMIAGSVFRYRMVVIFMNLMIAYHIRKGH